MRYLLVITFCGLVFFSCTNKIENLIEKDHNTIDNRQTAKVNNNEGLEVSIDVLGTQPFRGEIVIVNNCGTLPVGDFGNKIETTYIEPDGTTHFYEKGNITGTYIGKYELGDTIRKDFIFTQFNIKHMIKKAPQNGYYKYIQSLNLDEACKYEVEMEFYIDLNLVD